jgi:drug/metabolite transporter (DMT)-like permease
LGLAVVGVLVISGTGLSVNAEALKGDGLALLGAAGMAGYLLVARPFGDSLDIWIFSAIATGVGSILLLGTAALLSIPWEVSSMEALFYLALAALIPQMIGHTLLTWSLRHATPTTIGIATVGEPVGATFLAWIWLGDPVSWGVVIGSGITLAAVVLAIRRPSQNSSKVQETE